MSDGRWVGFTLKGRGGVDAACGAGPHVRNLDGPARVSPGGREPGGGAASAQEASAEMLGASHSRYPASRLRRTSLESGWLGALPRPPSTQRVSAQVGSSCRFCFRLSFPAAATVRTQCPSPHWSREGQFPAALPQGFQGRKTDNLIKLTQESS